jgi:hypothetical protein
MRTLLAVVVLVALEAVGHAQVTISIGPQGQPFGIGPQGQYLANPSGSPVDPDSRLNPFLRPGSRLGAGSINAPYGQWGSPYSTNSMTNPSTTRGPRMVQPFQPAMPPGW